MALGDRGVGVVGGDDLALLGELEAAVDRPGRLREDRPVRRPAAAAERPAPAVEQRQRDAVRAGRRDQRLLGAIEQPVRREEPALLGRIRVAEHDLLGVAPVAEVGAVGRVAKEAVEELRRPREGVRALEQRHDVEHGQVRREVGERRHGPAERLGLRGDAGELEDGGHVVRAGGERDHVPAAGIDAEPGLEARDGPEGGEHLAAGSRRRRPRGPGPARVPRRSASSAARCTARAGAPRATRDGTRTPRAASESRRPRPTPRGPGRPRRARAGATRAPRRARRPTRSRPCAARPRPSSPPASGGCAPRSPRVAGGTARPGTGARSWRIGLGQLLGVAREGALEGPVQALGRDARRHGLHQPHRDGLVAAQQVVGLQRGRRGA